MRVEGAQRGLLVGGVDAAAGASAKASPRALLDQIEAVAGRASAPATSGEGATVVDAMRAATLHRRVTALARGLGTAARPLRIDAGDRWAYDARRGRLQYDVNELAAMSDAAGLGTILREQAKIEWGHDPAELAESKAALRYLWRVVDTARTDSWMRARYSGSARVIRQAIEEMPEKRGAALSEQFGDALLRRLSGAEDEKLAPEVASLLDRVMPLVEELVAAPRDLADLLPERNAALADDTWTVTRSELLPLFEEFLQAQSQNKSGDATQDGRPDPARDAESKNPSESDEALEKAAQDLESKAKQNPGESGAEGDASQTPGKSGESPDASEPSEKKNADGKPSEGAQSKGEPKPGEGSEESSKPADGSPGAGKPKPSGTEQGAGEPASSELGEPSNSAPQPSSGNSSSAKASTKPSGYSQDELERVLAASADKLEQSRVRTLGDDSLLRSLVVEAAPLTDRLKKRVELALQRDDNVKWAGPFTSGSQLDLKAYIQDELRRSAGLTPKGRVFLRRQPDAEVSRAFEFSIGIDLSYSMGLTPAAQDSDSLSWEKNLPLPNSAFFPMRLALVAMTEMFVHFEHPFAVSGFNTGAFVLKELEEKPDEATRERVVRDLKLGPNSHDQRGLEVACSVFGKKSDSRRIVFMLVDADRSELTRARVSQLEKEHDVTIIGVGIGDGCREVQRIYERYVLAPSIQDLPDLLGERLTQLIQGAP